MLHVSNYKRKRASLKKDTLKLIGIINSNNSRPHSTQSSKLFTYLIENIDNLN